jgi:mercuric ion transport protein
MAQKQEINKQKTLWLGMGTILAAIGASVCCVGPLLLLSLGFGGAWMSTLTSMEAVRPFFFALTLLLIWMGFMKVYLSDDECQDSDVCVDPKVHRNQRIIFWIGSISILLLLSVPWIISSPQVQTESIAQAPPQASTQRVMLDVQNMTCAMCPITIKKALDGVDGVESATVDFNSKTALIKFDSNKTNVEALINMTTNVGYPATIHSEK